MTADPHEAAPRYDLCMARDAYPTSVEELEQRLAGAAPATDDDQSRTLAGEVLDSREAIEGFLAEVERARRVGQQPV